ISSADAEKEYDGTALTTAETENAGITVSGDGFADGEGAAYTVTGSQTIPGESENTFTYRLNAGTDAANYDITTKNGTLKVTGRSEKTAVTIQASGGSYLYDGEEHTVQGLTAEQITVDGVVYTITGITCSETQTDAGTYPVKAEGELKILDADGNDVTDQFDPEILEGSLQILPRELVLTSADAQKEYDGTALTTADLPDGGITVSGDGFADGEGFDVKAQGSQLLPGSSVNSISYKPQSGTKEENYRIRLEEGTLTVTDRVEPVRITITGNSDDVLYDGKEHSAEGLTGTEFKLNGISYTVEGLEAAVSGTDAGTYTGTISGTAKILDADGNDVTGQFTVTGTAGTLQIRRRSLILTSADAEKVYDGTPLTTADLPDGGITVSGDGFVEGEGAQYSVTGTQMLAGNSANAFTYQLNEGTKAENYDIEVHMGLLRVTGRGDTERYEIMVTGQSADALYDGTTHSVEDIVTDTFTIEGHTYTVTGLAGSVSGVNAGTYEANVTGAPTVLDALGNDVTDQFNVRTQPVTLTILPREVTLTSADAEKEYDGTRLTTADMENAGITVSGDGFAAGEGAAYTVTGSQTLVGVSGNTFTYELNEGTKEQNYRITVIPGTLSVTGRTSRIAITASAVGTEAVYDGEEHTAPGLEQTVVTFNGKQETLSGLDSSVSAVDAGTYLASVTGTAKVTDEDGNDVTDQFAVSLQSAELRILPAPLTISTGSAEKAYDGTALTAPETEITGLQGRDRISVLATGTLTEPGSTQNTCEINWGETKPSNYQVSLEPGTLQVSANAAQVVLRAADASKTYDGTELTGSDEVTAEGLPAGFRAE
ncbi:MAG: hypothetical protein IJH21_02440, partial [Oscillospiraceae bacterium]|nr:hypothetical protein [Oscillospiraceae bacterium]